MHNNYSKILTALLILTHSCSIYSSSVYTLYTADTIKETFASIGGAEEAIAILKDTIDFFNNADAYRELWEDATPPMGILLHGNPGNGKTLLARAFAGESKCPFIVVNCTEIGGLVCGQSARDLKKIFEVANQYAPCVLFFDEIDSLAAKRSPGTTASERENTDKILQFLMELDGFVSKERKNPIVVIGATNRLDVLDPAVTRSGRLEYKIHVGNPNQKARHHILTAMASSGKAKLSDDVDLEAIASLSDGFNGADVASILRNAVLIAGRSRQTAITMTNLLDAMNIVKNNTSKTHVEPQKIDISELLSNSLSNVTKTVDTSNMVATAKRIVSYRDIGVNTEKSKEAKRLTFAQIKKSRKRLSRISRYTKNIVMRMIRDQLSNTNLTTES